jgi:hypothetical protein
MSSKRKQPDFELACRDCADPLEVNFVEGAAIEDMFTIKQGPDCVTLYVDETARLVEFLTRKLLTRGLA